MNQPKKILACVDQSPYADYVADYSAWAARRFSLPLELLHIIDRHPEIATSDDHSGAIGFDAQENLLNRLTEEEGQRSREIRERGRVFLNGLKQRCERAGTGDVDIRQRYGQLLDTLDEQQREVALYVLGRRGRSAAHTQRDLGRHVESISRKIQRPILTVASEFSEPKSLLVAYDGKRMTRGCITLIAGNAALADLPVHVVMSGKQTNESEKQLHWATETLELGGFSVETAYLPGDPEQQIMRVLNDREIDLLVMGAYSQSPLRSLFLGSRTNDLLRASRVPTVTVHL
ncbi:MAG: universal stress protein [Luminiphilus sp.]|jgi:nucleotide-binding universal stress UspA family protein|nr:universal stress protein [Luminiphilus sp.]MDG1683056.1 universal stress protein [Luminiphilus sp.]